MAPMPGGDQTPEREFELDDQLRRQLRGWGQPLADLGPGRLVVQAADSERTITVDPDHGIRIAEPDGSTWHLLPDGRMHQDADPEVCREEPFVLALGAHLEDPAIAYDVTRWLHGAGNEALATLLDEWANR